MATYLGRIQSAVTDFNVVLPITADLVKQKKQKDKLFMVLSLARLGADVEGIHAQIFSSPAVPTMEKVFIRILHSTQTFSEASIGEQSILAS